MNRELETNSINMTVESVKKSVENRTILLDHPLQRKSGQWQPQQKGNFIRRLLWGDHILPLNICTQRDPITNYEYQYLIDGKQRATTVVSYINDEFSISKTITNPIIKYSGVKYETKKSGQKICLRTKIDKETGKITYFPLLDERGNKQYGVMEFDIRGAKFSQLPPELQEKIKWYNLPFIIKKNCTDEQIQQEIIDFNSGSAMNVEQKGVNLLGVNWASKIQELSETSFIKNSCSFTKKEETKSKVERAVVETIGLTYFTWNSNYQVLCNRLIDNLTQNHIDEMKNIFDEMGEIIGDNSEIKDYINAKELPVIISTYHYFKSLSYENNAFGMFLLNWVNTLRYEKSNKCDDEYKSYDEIYGKGASQPKSFGAISGRLNIIRNALDIFLETECEVFKSFAKEENSERMFVYEDISDSQEQNTEEIEVEGTNSSDVLEDNAELTTGLLDEFTKNFEETRIASYVSESESACLAKRCLMVTVSSPYVGFNQEDLNKFSDWFNKNGDSDMEEYCLLYAEQLADILENAQIEETLINLKTIPMLIYAMKYINDTEKDEYAQGWIVQFLNHLDMFPNIAEKDSSYIVSNCNNIENNIDQYLQRRNVA